MNPLPEPTAQHLEKVRAFYDSAPTEVRWAARGYRSLLAHYYNLIIPADASVLEIGCGSGELLHLLKAARKTGIDLSATQIAAARQRVPDAEFHVMAGEQLDLLARRPIAKEPDRPADRRRDETERDHLRRRDRQGVIAKRWRT